MSGSAGEGALNAQLADALQTQDVAAVAFALRHGPTFVPHDEGGGVWIHTDPASGAKVLLLFSAAARAEGVPAAPVRATPADLRPILMGAAAEGATVVFDIGGPHRMMARPEDLIAALDA
jgi:hypothetical protein